MNGPQRVGTASGSSSQIATSSVATASVATVRVAIPLDDDEMTRLTSSLERRFGGPITLDIEIDPSVIGGVWLRVGDTVIDGSLSGRLSALQQHLCAQCRTMLSSGYMPPIEQRED